MHIPEEMDGWMEGSPGSLVSDSLRVGSFKSQLFSAAQQTHSTSTARYANERHGTEIEWDREIYMNRYLVCT